MKNNRKTNSNTILQGVILPTKWDNNGRAMRISLNTRDEKVYTIDYSGPGKELIQHLRETIEIEGKVFRQLDGALYVKVKQFYVLG